MISKLKKLQDEQAQVTQSMRSMLNTVEAQNRQLNAEESTKYEGLDKRAAVINHEILAEQVKQDEERNLPTVANLAAPLDGEGSLVECWSTSRQQKSAPPAEEWKDQFGNAVRLIRSCDRFADLPVRRPIEHADKFHIGKLVRGMITGKWRDAELERLAMSEGTDSAGGYVVADEVSNRIIDMSRNLSVVMRAGAVSFPMETDSLRVARITTDPTMALKTENSAFTPTDLVLDAVQFTAKLSGCVVYLSRELAEDAPNVQDAIQNAMVQTLATNLDACAIMGASATPNLGITGIVGHTGVGTIATVGAIAWTDILDGMEQVELLNGVPNAFIVNPAVTKDLRAQVTGDGTTAAKAFQTPPPDVQKLMWLNTNNIALANAIVGDFTKAAFGIRTGALIEVTQTGGNTFDKHQVGVKITTRIDFNLLRNNHFCVLSGITST